MILENTFDQLVQKIWCDDLVDVAAWEVRSEWLRIAINDER
jgi:hypothetical protein